MRSSVENAELLAGIASEPVEPLVTDCAAAVVALERATHHVQRQSLAGLHLRAALGEIRRALAAYRPQALDGDDAPVPAIELTGGAR